MNTPTQAF